MRAGRYYRLIPSRDFYEPVRWMSGQTRRSRCFKRSRSGANTPMPIIEIPASDSPLQQGDILRGVTLFCDERAWLTSGGGATKTPFEYCLVRLSARLRGGTQAACRRGGCHQVFRCDPVKNLDSLLKVLQFLCLARMGVHAPDLPYLGQLPRFAWICISFGSMIPSSTTLPLPAGQGIAPEFSFKTNGLPHSISTFCENCTSDCSTPSPACGFRRSRMAGSPGP